MSQKEMPAPDLAQETKEIPDTAQGVREVQELNVKTRELPEVGNPENTVMIGGRLIEIRPMKLKYQRNRTAVFYHVLETYPLADILAMENPFGDGRDGDKALCDWLVAATDNEELIREHIDEIDSDTVYRILAIFRRINKIDELEAKLKNAKAPAMTKV